MSWFLWFIIVTVNVGLNMMWIIGFVKCSPMSKAWDPSVEGHCCKRCADPSPCDFADHNPVLGPKGVVMQYGYFAGCK